VTEPISDDAEIGVSYEKHNPNDSISIDDVDWAIEQGAKNEEEILTMIREHKEQEEWQQ
jgi:hypothetical protein